MEPRTEALVGSLIVEGQRQEVWLRAERDAAGVWHDALVFRRDGIHSTREEMVVGVGWHLPPEEAVRSAVALEEVELRQLFSRALSARPPVS